MGENVFRDHAPIATGIPESSDDFWLGNGNVFPQKLRIGFSCPKTISSVRLRNSILKKNRNTNEFEVKVREPNSALWVSFITGTMPNPFGQTWHYHVQTFNGTAITAMEVEFSCLSAHANGSAGSRCALVYIKFN